MREMSPIGYGQTVTHWLRTEPQAVHRCRPSPLRQSRLNEPPPPSHHSPSPHLHFKILIFPENNIPPPPPYPLHVIMGLPLAW